jgi:hypothetical protein
MRVWRRQGSRLCGIADGCVEQHSHSGESLFLRKLGLPEPHDPGIALLDIYLRETKIFM